MLRPTGVMLVLLLIYQLVAQAKVAGPGVTARDEDSSSSRSMSDIIWGCVSTTIICAWAAVHPNIPPPEGPLKQTLRRLELMFWTIVAPEILPSWALKQLLAAITVRDVYNEGKGYETKRCGIWETVKRWGSLYEIKEAPSPAWTIVHGHFLVMGGFHIVEPPILLEPAPTEKTNTETEKGRGPSDEKPKGRVTILTLEMLQKLVKDPDFDIRRTELEITNLSKGDALSKLIFILQSTWFILQCIGRRVQGLNLTHLELTTLALASLNGITFVLWWDKPLGAQAVMRVHLKRKLSDSEREPEKDDHSARSEIAAWTQKAFGVCVSIFRDAFRGQPGGLFLLPFAVILLLLWPVITITLAFFTTLIDLVRPASPSFLPDATHVTTFYVPKHRYPMWFHMLLLVTLGVVFGGIHCSGWNFSFPTYSEQKLWRTASLAVTIIPIATSFFTLIFFYLRACLPPSVTFLLALSTLIVCALAYVSARLVLLGLALALLRHLPPSAYVTINWTKFYPLFL